MAVTPNIWLRLLDPQDQFYHTEWNERLQAIDAAFGDIATCPPGNPAIPALAREEVFEAMGITTQ